MTFFQKSAEPKNFFFQSGVLKNYLEDSGEQNSETSKKVKQKVNEQRGNIVFITMAFQQDDNRVEIGELLLNGLK